MWFGRKKERAVPTDSLSPAKPVETVSVGKLHEQGSARDNRIVLAFRMRR